MEITLSQTHGSVLQKRTTQSFRLWNSSPSLPGLCGDMMAFIANSAGNFFFWLLSTLHYSWLFSSCILLQLKISFIRFPLSLLENVFMYKEILSLDIFMEHSHHLLALTEIQFSPVPCFSPRSPLHPIVRSREFSISTLESSKQELFDAQITTPQLSHLLITVFWLLKANILTYKYARTWI